MTLATEQRFFFFFAHPRPLLFIIVYYLQRYIAKWKSQDHSKAVTNIIFTLCLLNLWQFLVVDFWRQAHEEKKAPKGFKLETFKIKGYCSVTRAATTASGKSKISI